jgi:hypothetical protein
MQIDKLQLDLRPRPNAQALDLGFALLRAHAGHVYGAWLALWIPLVVLSYVLAIYFPDIGQAWMFLAWWLKPLLERAPLYVLSRQVFGEAVSWRQALVAWPKQLGGGWFRLLTWWRIFVPGRGLYQAIWQLEGARGAVAAQRRRVIGAHNTARNASWFGVACAHFEAILQLGFVAFVGIFVADENIVNPFAYLIGLSQTPSAWTIALSFFAYALAGAIIGPIYTACCFTLYLNRRATLEAWDIELTLRQIHAPSASAQSASRTPAASRMLGGVGVVAILFLACCLQPNMGYAAAPANTPPQSCSKPEWLQARDSKQADARVADHTAAQTRLRQDLRELLEAEDLRNYQCVESWFFKERDKDKKAEKNKPTPSDFDFPLLAQVIKIILIVCAVLLVLWLLLRYRGTFLGFFRPATAVQATEVGGLDIRAETLPTDVVAQVRAFWQQQRNREALALLYRATLSRLVTHNGVVLTQGATEGDCLRIATHAQAQQRISATQLDIVRAAGDMWLRGAYGKRWPTDAALQAVCADWKRHFDQVPNASVGAA